MLNKVIALYWYNIEQLLPCDSRWSSWYGPNCTAGGHTGNGKYYCYTHTCHTMQQLQVSHSQLVM